MVSRSILALFAIALLFAVAFAEEVDVDIDNQDLDEDAERGLASSIGKQILKGLFSIAKKEWDNLDESCLKSMFSVCPNPVAHPQRFTRCATQYLPEHHYCNGKH